MVETLVAITILGVIAIPLSGLLLDYFQSNGTTNGRLAETRDAQLTAAYFAQDVGSIGILDSATPPALTQSVETNVAYNAGLFPCGAAGTPNALIRLAWDDFSSAGAASTQVRVAYVVRTVGSETQLHRLYCAGSATVVTDIVVAHKISTTSAPTVACSTACTGSGTSVPQSVTMTLTMDDPKSSAPPYTITLTGQRRQT